MDAGRGIWRKTQGGRGREQETPDSVQDSVKVTVHSAPFAKPRCALSAASQLPLLKNWRSLRPLRASHLFVQARHLPGSGGRVNCNRQSVNKVRKGLHNGELEVIFTVKALLHKNVRAASKRCECREGHVMERREEDAGI